MSNPRIQTLHSHTTSSDGELSHEELLQTASRFNIGTVAFTDHDLLMPSSVFTKIKQSGEFNVRFVSGIEMSSGLPKELSGKPYGGFHVVGLFVNPDDDDLIRYSKDALSARITRMQKMVSNLRAIGFDVTEEDCYRASQGESVGRPHIVKAIYYNEKNIARIEEIRLQMKKESENNLELRRKYDEMMSAGQRQYPYALFLGENSYISNVFVEYSFYVDLDTTVSLIRNAGGIALLAHPDTALPKVSKEKMEELVRDKRIDGIETVFGLWNLGTEREEISRSMRAFAKSLKEKYNLLPGGGADVHKVEDLRDFALDRTYSEQTIGFAEEIISSSKVNAKWSSF